MELAYKIINNWEFEINISIDKYLIKDCEYKVYNDGFLDKTIIMSDHPENNIKKTNIYKNII